MLDSDFWRSLAAEFRALVDPYLKLRAEWSYTVPDGEIPPPIARWRFVGTGHLYRSLQLAFIALASRAGPKVYPLMESLTGWLESIRYYGLYEEHALQGESANPEGQVVGHSRMGTVIDLCQASVDLCKHLESLALEEERKDGLRRSEELKAEESQSYKATFDENSLKPDIPSSLSALVEENASGDSDDPIAAERSSAILKFKSRAKAQGIRVTDEMVAKAAKPGKWNTRTMVTWWKRNDKRCERPHDRLIRSVLARDPRSVWPPDHGEN